MAEGTVICRRCGVVNTAGDQFCGSCGAFLEWEGDAAEAAPPAMPAPTPPPPVEPSPASWTPPTTPDQSPDSIACPSCGTLNAPQKTFCQSCGTDLRSAARTSASAGAAPAGTRASQAEKSGGIPFWLPLVVAVGLVAGIGFVVAGIVLRPTPVAPGATTAASVTFTPTLPPSAPASPGTSPSAPAVEAIPLTAMEAKASSVVGNRPKFMADKAIDNDLETCWQEGVADEKGQWIEISFAPSQLDYVVIYSGYQLNHDAFRGNLRPENVLVSVNGGTPITFILADSEQPQRLDLDDTSGATTVRVEIVSSFDAVATAYPGSPFDDLAITEIRAFGSSGG